MFLCADDCTSGTGCDDTSSGRGEDYIRKGCGDIFNDRIIIKSTDADDIGIILGRNISRTT